MVTAIPSRPTYWQRLSAHRCDFLVLVEGWEESEGTLAEVRLAKMREMDVFTFEELKELADKEDFSCAS